MRRWYFIAGLCVLLALAAGGLWYARRTAARPVNVLLITLDTTRADRLHCYGYAETLTPAIDSLAASGTLFESAFSPVPLTLSSHTTMLTGLLPPEHGIRTNGLSRLDSGIPTLAETLRARGYHTGAFVAASVLNARFGLDRGFQVYDDDMSRAYAGGDGEALSVCRSGNLVTDAALSWLGSQGSAPFFCWVHLYDAHHPYHAHPELGGTLWAAKETYDAQIAFMDMQVARLRKSLVDTGSAAHTLVIVAGDHGEGLGDHHERAHGYMLYDTTQHVPLIVSAPRVGKQGMRVSSQVGLVDLYATVLDALQIPAARSTASRSLMPLVRGQSRDEKPCYIETDLPYSAFGWCPLRGLITSKWKYVRTRRPELYDRSADPSEQSNLADRQPEVLHEFEQQLAEYEKGMTPHAAAAVAVDSQSRRQLESLGYIGHTTTRPASQVDYTKLSDIKDMISVADMAVDLGSLSPDEPPDKPLAICRKMAQISPDSARVRCYLGSSLVKTGKLDEAMAEFQAAARIDSSIDAVYAGLGEALAAQNKMADAQAAWTHALELNPNNDEVQTELGVALAREGKFEPAIAHLVEAARLRPADAKANYNLARVQFDAGKIDDSIAHVSESIRLDPANGKAICLLGGALLRQGKTDQAAAMLSRGLGLDPRNADAHNNLAVVFARRGRFPEAMKECEAALTINPDHADAHNNLGGVFLAQGSLDQAAAQFREALRINPGHDKSASSLAVALARQGKLEEARVQCAKALQLNPRSVEAHNTMGILQSLAGELEPAIASYRESLQIDPNNVQAQKLLAAAVAQLNLTGTPPGGGIPQ